MKETWLWIIEILMVLIPLGVIIVSSRVALTTAGSAWQTRQEPSTAQEVAQSAETDIGSLSKLTKTAVIGLAVVGMMTTALFLSIHHGWLSALIGLLPSTVRTYGWLWWTLAMELTMFLVTVKPRRTLRRLLVLGSFSLMIALALTTHNWIVGDLYTLTNILFATALLQSRMSFAKLSMILFIVAVLYDAVQVFGTGNMFTAVEQMSKSPTGFALSALVLPKDVHHPALVISPHGSSSIALIGAGDILLSCVLAVSAGRVAQRTKQRSIRRAAYGGFVLASLLCLLIEFIFKSGQPMTIYLVPCVAFMVVLSAKRAGVLRELLLPAPKQLGQPGATTEPAEPDKLIASADPASSEA